MKKVLCVFFAMVFMLVSLAACGGQNDGSTETKASQKQESEKTAEKQVDQETTEGQEPVTIVFLNTFNDNTMTVPEEIQKSVNEKYPYITVESEVTEWANQPALLQTRIAANEVPDMLNLLYSDVPLYEEILLDLTDKPFMSNVVDSVVESTKVNGKNLCIPYTSMNQGTFYNKDIFNKYDISIPKTYDDLIQACEKLQSNGVMPFATHFKDNWNIGNITMQFAMVEVFNKYPNWGDDLYAGKVSFSTSPEYRKVFEHTKDVFEYTDQNTFSYDQTKAVEAFAKGETAMYITGTWNVPSLKQVNPELNYGIFPFPGTEPGAKLLYQIDTTFSAGVSSKYIDAVLKVLQVLTEDKELAGLTAELQGESSLIKDVKVDGKEGSPVMQDILEYAKNNQIVDVDIGNLQVPWAHQAEYSKYIAEWILEQKTLEETLKAADDYKDQIN